MARIQINDLEKIEELDAAAMKMVFGGSDQCGPNGSGGPGGGTCGPNGKNGPGPGPNDHDHYSPFGNLLEARYNFYKGNVITAAGNLIDAGKGFAHCGDCHEGGPAGFAGGRQDRGR